jgi:hypothetical protein
MRTLFLLVTLACVWLSWQSAKIREQESRRRRDLADVILLGHHWQVWESQPKAQPYVTHIPGGITTAIRSYPTRFLTPGGSFSDGGRANQFEESLISRFDVPAGADYIRDGCFHTSDKVVYYYRPVRARRNCVECHGKPLEQGDLMAIMKIQLPEQPPNSAQPQSSASMPNRLERRAIVQHLVN